MGSGVQILIRLRGYKTSDAHLNMKFQLLIKTKLLKNINLSCLKHSSVVFILLMNVKINIYKQDKFHTQCTVLLNLFNLL